MHRVNHEAEGGENCSTLQGVNVLSHADVPFLHLNHSLGHHSFTGSWCSHSTVSQVFEQRVLKSLSSCDPGGRVQIQQLIQQVVSLIGNSVPATLILLLSHLFLFWKASCGVITTWMFVLVRVTTQEFCRSFICFLFVWFECSFSGTVCGRIILDLVMMSVSGICRSLRKWCDFVIWRWPQSSERLTQGPEVLSRELPTAHHRFTWIRFKPIKIRLLCTEVFYNPVSENVTLKCKWKWNTVICPSQDLIKTIILYCVKYIFKNSWAKKVILDSQSFWGMEIIQNISEMFWNICIRLFQGRSCWTSFRIHFSSTAPGVKLRCLQARAVTPWMHLEHHEIKNTTKEAMNS